jgi:spermidine synthase
MRSAILSIRPQNILMLGGAGCSVISSLDNDLPSTKITVVDRESAASAVAKKFFNPPFFTKFVSVGAVEFLRESRLTFDMILIDAFDHSGLVPSEMVCDSVANDVRRNLREGGVLLWNVSVRKKREWFCALADISATLASAGIDTFTIAAASPHSATNAMICHGPISIGDLPAWRRCRSRPKFYRPITRTAGNPFSWPAACL